MTTPPDKSSDPIPLHQKETAERALKEATKINRSLTDEGGQELNVVRHLLKNWAPYKEKTIAEKHAEATIELGKKIVQLFLISVFIFVLVGCYLAVFSDETHIKNFTSIMQTVGSLLTWAVGFVMGHYFTNKNDR